RSGQRHRPPVFLIGVVKLLFQSRQARTPKTRIEGIDFGLFDQFLLSAAVEWTEERDGVRDFERLQMTLHRWAGDAERRRGLGHFELAAALTQDVFEQGVEPVHIPERKQPLDVPGEE